MNFFGKNNIVIFLLLTVTLVNCGSKKTDLHDDAKVTKNAFISEWKLTRRKTLTLPTPSGYNYNYTVDWGDGKKENITNDNASHEYNDFGTYTIMISGIMPAWNFKNKWISSDDIINVIDLGDVGWENLSGAFHDCSNLETTFGGNMSTVTDMSEMFTLAKKVQPDVSQWDTSNVTNMFSMFTLAKKAQPDVSQWDTSNVTNMAHMFALTDLANPDVRQWDTSSVTDMKNMFFSTLIADPDVSQWDTSSVIDMSLMFFIAEKANPDVSKWNVENVIDMVAMFSLSPLTNPDVSSWNALSLKNASFIFDETLSLSNVNYSNFLIMLNNTADINNSHNIERVGDGHLRCVDSISGANNARTDLLNKGWSIEDGGSCQ